MKWQPFNMTLGLARPMAQKERETIMITAASSKTLVQSKCEQLRREDKIPEYQTEENCANLAGERKKRTIEAMTEMFELEINMRLYGNGTVNSKSVRTRAYRCQIQNCR